MEFSAHNFRELLITAGYVLRTGEPDLQSARDAYIQGTIDNVVSQTFRNWADGLCEPEPLRWDSVETFFTRLAEKRARMDKDRTEGIIPR